jgi:uncharacterized membrane protein YvbJ
MAIIKCPQCGKKISDKSKECNHCSLNLENMSEEKLQSLSKIKSYQTAQTMMTHQAVAMLLFLGGVLALYNTEDTSTPQYTAAQASIAVGFFWYIINRFRMILAKRKRK